MDDLTRMVNFKDNLAADAYVCCASMQQCMLAGANLACSPTKQQGVGGTNVVCWFHTLTYESAHAHCYTLYPRHMGLPGKWMQSPKAFQGQSIQRLAQAWRSTRIQ